jgi:signal transduction histidine kinase/CheY-like chemotaxis protein
MSIWPTEINLCLFISVAFGSLFASGFWLRARSEILNLRAEMSGYIRSLAELEGEKDRAVLANKAKSLFLASVSHEIRTSLGSILGFAELLGTPIAPMASMPSVAQMASAHLDDSEPEVAISAIKRNSEQLLVLINDLLDLAKIEQGRFALKLKRTELRAILKDLESFAKLKANRKGLQFRMVASRDVPEIIMCDPVRLRQILFNIIGNAIKFTESGSVSLKIHRSHRDLGLLRFDVTDTGPGLTSEMGKSLFKPFSQCSNSSEAKEKGTGLGLVISQRLAQLMGGDIWIDSSEPGKGSTFSVEIRAQSNSQSVDQPAPEATQKIAAFDAAIEKQSTLSALKGLRVLLVDDAPDMRNLIARLLKKSGIIVDVAQNGEEAVEKALGSNGYDLVLMDIQMPIMDGFSALRELRCRGFRTPVIALTARAMTEERDACLRSGFNSHLAKPVRSDELLGAIARFAILPTAMTC